VIAGNKTLEAAVSIGLDDAIVVQTDGRRLVVVQRTDLDLATDAAAMELGVVDNRAAELGLSWDAPVLQSLAESGADLSKLFTADELAMLLGPQEGLTDPDAVPDVRATDIQAGDLFELGAHRLLCGDSTSADDVTRLLAGTVPFLMVTDPPYGVNYDPAWRNVEAAKGNLAYAARRVGQVMNDDRADWREAWVLFPGDVVYSWHPAGAPSLEHAAALQDSGFAIRMQIIWAKSNFPIGRGDYHVRHEPCWYAVREGRPAHRTDDRTQTTLWEINLDKNVEGGHSTQKPVECMARPIRNHQCTVVYDPFLGSGTTLIAAEQLRRAAFTIELAPVYCQASIDRWEAFTGQKAVKVDGR